MADASGIRQFFEAMTTDGKNEVSWNGRETLHIDAPCGHHYQIEFETPLKGDVLMSVVARMIEQEKKIDCRKCDPNYRAPPLFVGAPNPTNTLAKG